ncbi:RNA-binding cell elongation regulator Jag/EloR [Alloiococcus otitis]|uniref:RNA-binding cell elongation regulator Jag/EloR n=1 Tax=Alloiococcus otitis TaxID=1652 RepID=UPI0023561021|nr:RNA-binding cell elongation regulator Jag/EloR [Alloiococcus otitis]
MIEKYTAQAKTEEEAIEKGLKELGIARSEAEIQVNTPATKGFLGFGAKDAVVTVKRKGKSQVDQVLEETVPKNSPLQDASASLNEGAGDTKDALASSQSQTAPEQDTSDQSESSHSQAGEADFDQASSKQTESSQSDQTAVDQTSPASEKPLTNQTQDQDPENQTDKGPRNTRSRQDAFSQVPIQENQEDQEAISFVKDYLLSIISHMGVDDVTIETIQDQQFIKYDIDTQDAGLVIGRHGKVLNGLQTLAQIQLHQRADNKLHAHVDAENYRSRRKGTVEHLAKKTAQQVINTNQSVILEPMPAHERKQIHRQLSRYSEVQTHSEGKEPHRYLVVEPKQV